MSTGGRDRPHSWVTQEPHIDVDMPVIYEDSRIIVVDKPHCLASTPRGMWYRETALMRLREGYGEPDITPAHRLDRQTAGIMVFVRDPHVRGAYQMLFQRRLVSKTYECLAPSSPVRRPRFGTVTRLHPPGVFPLLRCSHIVKERGVLQAFEEPGTVNARTLVDVGDGVAGLGSEGLRVYVLHPSTGKTHQLRVHMNSLGLPIVGDDLYPNIVSRDFDDCSHPLQLVARSLRFTDPITGVERLFVSRYGLEK